VHDFLISSYDVRSPNLPELTPYAVSAAAAEEEPRRQRVTHQGNDVTTTLSPKARAARLEGLRRKYMTQIIAGAARHGRPVRVTPYVLSSSTRRE
jgi:hypothetical protein